MASNNRDFPMPDDRHYFEELRDKTFEKAIADGMGIIIPTDRQLSLDIDRQWPSSLPPYVARVVVANAIKEVRSIIHGGDTRLISLLYRFEEEFEVIHREAWRSAGGNCHVLLTLDRDLDPTTRIALQSMLGSDPMRELLNLRRVLCGADDPIALFRPPVLSALPEKASDSLDDVEPTLGGGKIFDERIVIDAD